jgi:HTH-type transcriptional regulator/antitoxin HigA
MEPRIIKNEKQYQGYLAEVGSLVVTDPDADSADGFRLELLAKLIEDYEKTKFAIPMPDPVDAIVFRMEQQGLLQKDIAPFLGGKNRASEILSRKRPLTLTMIRSLHSNLGIPLELLVLEGSEREIENDFEIDGSKVPIEELVRRGWIDAKMAVSDLLKRFEAPIGSPVRLRSTETFGSNSRTNITSVWLWLSRIRELADSQFEISKRFDRNSLNEEFIRYVTRLSYMASGPRLAKECLEEHGISLIIEPHLPKTHLDGAAMLGRFGTPVIGMTIRLDRIDNFWFTLIHELIHAWKHLDKDVRRTIADENIEKHSSNDEMEVEANELAKEILLPTGIWRRSEVFFNPTTENIRELARAQQIHPAIVAGRVRFERKDYSKFSILVGNRQARRLFPEVHW